MSTISKKVYRKKIRKLRNLNKQTLRDKLQTLFMGVPITESKVQNVVVDEENGTVTMDLLIVPYQPCINFKVVVDEAGVEFVND